MPSENSAQILLYHSVKICSKQNWIQHMKDQSHDRSEASNRSFDEAWSYEEDPGSIELVQTHISVVILTRNFVYKVKKTALLKKLERKKIQGIQYFSKGKRGLLYIGQYKGKKVGIKIKNPKSNPIVSFLKKCIIL